MTFQPSSSLWSHLFKVFLRRRLSSTSASSNIIRVSRCSQRFNMSIKLSTFNPSRLTSSWNWKKRSPLSPISTVKLSPSNCFLRPPSKAAWSDLSIGRIIRHAHALARSPGLGLMK